MIRLELIQEMIQKEEYKIKQDFKILNANLYADDVETDYIETDLIILQRDIEQLATTITELLKDIWGL